MTGRPCRWPKSRRQKTSSPIRDNQTELDDRIAAWTATLEAPALIERLNEHGIPNGDIYRAPDMLADAHFKAREAIVRIADPVFGPMRMQSVAPKLSDTPGAVQRTGPALGEHNAEILGGLLGIAEPERARLAEAGVV